MNRTQASPPTNLIAILAAAALVILILQPQPTWLPLVENYNTLAGSTDMATVAPALLDDYARQPWSAYRAANAGYAALALGQPADALIYFNRAAELRGWDPDLRRAVGDAYAALGDTEQALAAWETAWQEGLRTPIVLNRLAVAYEAQGDYAQAVAVLDTLLQEQPDNAVGHYRRGLLLLNSNLREAKTSLLTAARLSSELAPFADVMVQTIDASQTTDDRALQLAGLGFGLVNIGEYGLATTLLEESIALNPNLAAAHAYLGLAVSRQGGDGLPYFEDAVALAPESPLAHSLLGVYWREQGDLDQALGALQTAVNLDPINPALNTELGDVYLALGDLPNAEVWYSNAARLEPQNVIYATLLAEFYLTNDYLIETGYEWAARAVQLGPNAAAANDIYGYSLWLQARDAEAQAVLNYALELDPERATTYYHLGLVLAELGQYDDARNSYERAIALDPDGAVGNLAINALARLP